MVFIKKKVFTFGPHSYFEKQGQKRPEMKNMKYEMYNKSIFNKCNFFGMVLYSLNPF